MTQAAWYNKVPSSDGPLVHGIGSTTPSAELRAPWYMFPLQTWLTPLMRAASNHPLEFADLFRLLPKYEMASTAKRLEDEITRALDTMPAGTRMDAQLDAKNVALLKSKLMWICIRLFPKEMVFSLVLNLVSTATNITAPIIMASFLTFLEDKKAHAPSHGYYLCILFLLNQLANAFGWNSSQYYARGVAMAIRSAMSSVIYRKSMTMSTESRLKFSNGQVFNLIASDCANLETSFRDLTGLVAIPAIAIGLTALCVIYLGVPGAIGMAILILGIFLASFFMGRMLTLERQALNATDIRVKSTSEVLNTIKLVKLFAWENSFTNRIYDHREAELAAQRNIRVATVVIEMFIFGLPLISNLAVFTLFFVFGNELTTANVFTALTIINLIRSPISYIPFYFQLTWSGVVSFERIADFLLSPNRENQPTQHETSESDENAIVIQKGCFSWPGANEDGFASEETVVEDDSMNAADTEMVPIGASNLKRINLTLKKGTLTLIAGPVGAGKSSLLHAILGDMNRTEGTLDIYGQISYASQTPWLQSASIRDNILFGAAFDQQRYSTVLKACALERDLSLFSDGDQSQIGEKGVTLSGGQAARIGLARAVYADRDILLLDDPLAAVDAHVGKHLLESCLLKLCKGKTVILVTHQMQIASRVDNIVLMHNGLVMESGSYNELMTKETRFASLMQSFAGEGSSDQNSKPKPSRPKSASQNEVQVEGDTAKALMVVEERAFGSVALKYYSAYLLKTGGVFVLSFFLVCAIVWQAVRVFTDLWLTYWLSGVFPSFSSLAYILVYLGLAVAQSVLLFGISYGIAVGTINANRKLHNECLNSVMNAPMSFFETNPLGRIISRFSKDFSEVDRQLPVLIQQVMESTLSLIGTVVLIAYAVPLCLVLVVILFPLYLHFLKFFRASIRELKRLENLSRSPLYAHISETLSGLSTIRSYDRMHDFYTLQNAFLDAGNQPIYLKSVAECWMSNRAESFIALLIFAVALVGLVTNADAPLLGLGLSYALALMAIVNGLLPRVADLEARMNSIERIFHYITELPSEKKEHDSSVSESWPTKGMIEFNRFSLRYRDDLDPVLHDLSFRIPAGEKVGVVGRTGAGKSTIITAAFRLVEGCEGSISIDGVDVGKLSLDNLRSRLAIIPQAPTLFEGTIRFNLDPLHECDDEDIWHVLGRCALKEYVSMLDQKLDSPVFEGGANLSVGQRQLLCLGRAMLRKSKLLFIDEATASVDVETDSFIQQVIREEFEDATVVCIAHRLGTLIDYDKIMVLDAGELIEYDAPHVLLRDPGSSFSSLVDEMGESSASMLRSLAETAFYASYSKRKAVLD